MSGIKQPVTQVRLTNVAVVRLRVSGRRYELACYKNKLIDWREGVERDLDEVLQSRHVFSNVSKGVLAPDDGLQRDFGTRDAEAVARLILERGEMQVSEKERQAALQSLSRDVCALVSEMCINPVTRRPYPVRLIASGMRDCHFSLQPARPAKSQALALIRQLSAVMPIQRASMRVRISCDAPAAKALMRALQPLLAAVEDESWGGADGAQFRLTALLSPGAYRQVEELLAEQAGGGRATMDILDLKADNDDELQRPDADGDGDEQQQAAADMARLRIQQPQQQKQASAAAAPPAPRVPSSSSSSSFGSTVKSRKAARRDAAVEEIRTVGERRDLDEDERGGEAEVEDSAVVRQRQQQQASRLKKERKQRQQRRQLQGADAREDGSEAGQTTADGGEREAGHADDGGADDEAAQLPAVAQASKSRRRRKKAAATSSAEAGGAEAAQAEEPEAG